MRSLCHSLRRHASSRLSLQRSLLAQSQCQVQLCCRYQSSINNPHGNALHHKTVHRHKPTYNTFFSSITLSLVSPFAHSKFKELLRHTPRAATHTALSHSRSFASTSDVDTESKQSQPEQSTSEYDLTFLDDIFQTQWNTSEATKTHLREDVRYDVILLNAPGDVLIKKLCNHANKIICADGGANSLFRAGVTGINVIPDAIVGDLDSVEQNILDYYTSNGAKKVQILDQNDNDFHKALKYLLDLETDANYVICWGAFGERFDHEMQGFNVLCKYKMQYAEQRPGLRVVMMTGSNFAVVLKPGKHLIKCAKLQGPVCSVIPLYHKTTVSTKGLKYDMNNHVLEFGGLVSSSNGFLDKQHVEIENDQMVVFHTSCSVKVDYHDWSW